MSGTGNGLSRLGRLLPYSIRTRLLIILPLTALMPLVLIGSISYYSMSSILENKAERGVRSHLHEVRLSLENTLSQLNHVSQQLAYDGRVGKNLEKYFLADAYEKKSLQDDITNELSLINFTNPNMGLTFYYIGGTYQTLFENYKADASFSPDRLPLLLEANKIRYFGPHKSLNPLDGTMVFSAIRRVELPERDDLYIYIETNFKWAETIIQTEAFDDSISHFIMDPGGKVVYTERPDPFPLGATFPAFDKEHSVYGDYYVFEENSNQSWRVAAALPASEYAYEIRRWGRQFIGFALLSLAVSCLFAWAIWRTLYRPLRNLSRDIRDVKHHKWRTPARKSNNLEFDLIHGEFENMRVRIAELIGEIEAKERRKAELEVEKLMNQINPHFLHNTLDTVRWIARANGQAEIDRLVSTLNRLLHYNLGKTGSTTIRDELEAVKHYAALQSVRYHFHFDVRVQADERLLDLPIPRFLLQPIVENALYHGLNESGIIEVGIGRSEADPSRLWIEVKDNGKGMSQDEVDRLLADPPASGGGRVGLGIGLNYVKRMLSHKYGTDAEFRIESREGAGTAVILTIPLETKGEST
ncbi:sensor histidine kinase [Paenibacillus flagellatus]|uniref:sensor histidine kinase n=1 Tax=Paenibacillus flagellatus TaxID=2211139 RepID=UPI00130548B6|nr:histidine kinase [Paenibacillus flagellatus]